MRFITFEVERLNWGIEYVHTILTTFYHMHYYATGDTARGGHYHRSRVTICDRDQDEIKRSNGSPGENQTIKAPCDCRSRLVSQATPFVGVGLEEELAS